jgi:hypothetical protein
MPERLLVLRQEAQLLQVQQAQVQLELLAQLGVLAQPVARQLVLQLVLGRRPVLPVRMHRQMNR